MTKTLNLLAPNEPSWSWSKMASTSRKYNPFIMLMLNFMLNNVLHVAHISGTLIVYTIADAFFRSYVCPTTLDTSLLLHFDLFLVHPVYIT